MMRFSYMFQCLIAATFTCMVHSSFAATDLPRLDDPQLQGLLTTLQGEYEQYLTNKVGYLTRPSEAKPWPCALTSDDLNILAGTTSSDDNPEMKRQLIIQARQSKSDPIRVVFSNQTFYPVKAECEGGKLNGPVDYWVEFDSAIVTPAFSINNHQLKHAQITAKGNKAFGLGLNITTTLNSETIYNDPATSAMMSKQKKSKINAVSFSASLASEPPMQSRSVVLAHTVVDGLVTVSVTATRPLGDNGYELTHYGSFGGPSHRDYTARYKDGKLHGEQIGYPGMMGGKFPTPGYSDCYEDGEKILTTSCKVD